MKRYLLFVVALTLLLPVVAKAQPRDRDRDDRRGARGERIARVIRDCEERTNDFRQAVDHSWGRERHEDELDRSAARLERSLNRIRDSWNRDHDYERTRRNVGAAIDAGRDLNRILRNHRMRSHVDREWGAIRSELNNLADVFEQPHIRW
jgi:hypothetical protein